MSANPNLADVWKPIAPAPAGEVWNNPMVKMVHRTGEIITGQFAHALLDKAGLFSPTAPKPLVVLDNASGTGIVVSVLMKELGSRAEGIEVVCGDINPLLIQATTEIVEKEKWKAVRAEVVDLQDMKVPHSHFTHVLASFAIIGVPDPAQVLRETLLALKPEGMAGFTTWRHLGWIDYLRAALASIPGAPVLPPDEEVLDFMGTGNWGSATFVKKLMETAGFEAVEVSQEDKFGRLQNGQELIDLFGMVMIRIATKTWTEEQKAAYSGQITPALLQYLEGRYGKDKPVDMSACALIVVGRKPKSWVP